MVQLSNESIQKFKELMEEKSGKEVTWEEAAEGGRNLVNLFDVLYKCEMEHRSWDERLKKEPKGFALEGNGRNCAVCGTSTREDTNWYDKWGIKCFTCQRAIDKKLIPGSVARSDKSVTFYPKPSSSKLHPTMKPVGLLRRLILNSTKVGDTVYDPFGGSGSTLVACEHTKRKCIMVEMDPEYCETIVARWQKLTGYEQARQADTGANPETSGESAPVSA